MTNVLHDFGRRGFCSVVVTMSASHAERQFKSGQKHFLHAIAFFLFFFFLIKGLVEKLNFKDTPWEATRLPSDSNIDCLKSSQGLSNIHSFTICTKIYGVYIFNTKPRNRTNLTYIVLAFFGQLTFFPMPIIW